jgi:hypothetical protein
MKDLLRHVDQLLRGHFTRREDLLAGRIGTPTDRLVTAALVLGGIYGAFMGIYAVLRPVHPSVPQLLATIVKVPLLFLATLVVTFPSLYVFSALANSRLHGADTLRLLVAAITVNLALLASFGPVTGFFTLSTSSYPFLVVLNVVFFAISGFAGLTFLRRALGNLFAAEPPAPTPADPDAPAPPADSRRHRAAAEPGQRVFTIWTITYALVGAQMGWILRPFIGVPTAEFTLFRPRDSNFFEGLWSALRALFA